MRAQRADIGRVQRRRQGLRRAGLLALQPAEAATEFEAALEKQPEDWKVRLGLARALLRTDRHADSVAHFEALATQFPGKPQLLADWGEALGRSRRFDEGIAKLDEAIAIDPNFVTAHVRKVSAFAGVGRCKEAKQAKKALGKALKRVKATPEAAKVANAAYAPCEG